MKNEKPLKLVPDKYQPTETAKIIPVKISSLKVPCNYGNKKHGIIKQGLLRWRSHEEGLVLWFQGVKDRFVLSTFRSEYI